MVIPTKVISRLTSNLKRFQSIIEKAKSKDINEADTVTIVADMLADMFGYDKYTEVTSEYAIRSTFVDLAVKKDDKILFLIEVKSIGTELKIQHIRQSVNYAVKEGVEWVVLTNGAIWIIYRVKFGKPVWQEQIAIIDMLSLSVRKSSDIEMLFILSKEGLKRSSLEEYHALREATNKFTVSAMIQQDVVVRVIRRELRKLFPDVKIDSESIEATIVNETLKREVVESDEAISAKKLVIRLMKKKQKNKVAIGDK